MSATAVRRVVEAVVDWARQRGCAAVGLSVRSGDDPAIGPYRRCGFERVAQRPDFLADYARCEIYMVRALRD